MKDLFLDSVSRQDTKKIVNWPLVSVEFAHQINEPYRKVTVIRIRFDITGLECRWNQARASVYR